MLLCYEKKLCLTGMHAIDVAGPNKAFLSDSIYSVAKKGYI